MNKLLTLLIIFLSSVISVSAQSDWITTESQKSKISFRLPDRPIFQEKELNGITIEVYSYKDVANVYGIVASDLTAVGMDFTYSDPTEYYNEMKEGSLVTGNAILILERSVAYKKMLGKEIVYTQLVGKHEYTYYKRFFFRGKYVYQIAIGGPSRMKQVLLDKKDLFFNTIKFIE